MSFDDFASQLQQTQADYVAAKQVCRPAGSDDGIVLVCAGCRLYTTVHIMMLGHPCAWQACSGHKQLACHAPSSGPSCHPPLQAGDVDGMKRALFQVHETQAFWALPGGEAGAGGKPTQGWGVDSLVRLAPRAANSLRRPLVATTRCASLLFSAYALQPRSSAWTTSTWTRSRPPCC